MIFTQLYTVVRHVKQAHHCQESGESQQFIDDIEYLLDGLKDSTSVSTRCLSTISLVEKSAAPAFRMHLRAHGMISKLFGALKDAAKDPVGRGSSFRTISQVSLCHACGKHTFDYHYM